ncbi:hypothetical protein [Plantactinospora sp. CA-290183]|uniref:hypothetical protein n=1 Tax=Plantactinospora sp. CA-290183 TaxID=3240006 RepID=UPI003D8F3852
MRFATRFGAVLVCAAGGFVLPVPAMAAGTETVLTEVPAEFVAGGGLETVTAVVSTSDGGGCRKVRWSLLLRADGLRLDQIAVERIEEDGRIPLEITAEDGGARLTDRELDPGTLCRDRTVTARYRLSVDGDVTDGRISLAVEAYDTQSRLLDRGGVTREVVSERRGRTPADRRADRRPPTTRVPTPAPEDSASAATGQAEASPGQEPEDGGALDEDVAGGAGAGGADAAAGQGGTGLLQLGFVVGGALLFLGAGLLLRLRARGRVDPEAVFASGGVPPAGRSAPARRRRASSPRRGHQARRSGAW